MNDQPAQDDAAPELLHEVREGGIAWTTLNRPRARNAMTFAMYEGLARLSAEVSADDAVRAWVITGAGEKAFAAGTDIAQFRAFRTGRDALDYESKVDRVLTAIENCRKPTIAAIAGACTGGGFAIAAVCDLRLATADARLGLPMARTLGNTLSMISHARFAALIGAARVADLIFTARLMGAEEARNSGLLTDVLPDHAALQVRAEELARTVAGHAPMTMRATKESLRRLRAAGMTGAESDDLVEETYMSADFREGVESFLARRPASWTGR